MRRSRATILVSGMIAGDPWQGGATWAVLQYILGFARLGHKVFFVEPIQKLSPPGCPLPDSEQAQYFRQVISEFQLEGSAALILPETRETFGLNYEELRAHTKQTDLLLNISGLLTDYELTSSIPIRVYLDLDPAFNQLWSAVEGINMRFPGHTHYMTIGQKIGTPDCEIPTCGLVWHKTLQPVVLDQWPMTCNIQYDALTTVANWRGYGSIIYQGVLFGQKAHSFRRLISLPTLTSEKFKPAIAIHDQEVKDVEALKANGWELINPAHVAHTPAAYRNFVQQSKAELGIAKSGYVLSGCGWFSDRSACYLASGKPVIAQDTGFSGDLPIGAGLFAFKNQEEALSAIEEVRTDYHRHARQARAIAEAYFDSNKVLDHLLSNVGLQGA